MVRRRRYGARRYYTRRFRGRYYGRYERGDSGDTSSYHGNKAWNPINYPDQWTPRNVKGRPPARSGNPIKGGFGYPPGHVSSGGFVRLLGYAFGGSFGGFGGMRGYGLD